MTSDHAERWHDAVHRTRALLAIGLFRLGHRLLRLGVRVEPHPAWDPKWVYEPNLLAPHYPAGFGPEASIPTEADLSHNSTAIIDIDAETA